jgi:hypothetical protein
MRKWKDSWGIFGRNLTYEITKSIHKTCDILNTPFSHIARIIFNN